jgi:hypothetical protein
LLHSCNGHTLRFENRRRRRGGLHHVRDLLAAIGTEDLKSGYVFGMSLNFDEQMIEDVVEADAAAGR